MPRLTSETGVLTYDKAKTKPGYTLFSTLGLFETTLVDMDGAVVHSWKLPGEPGNYAYMLPDGHLLAAIRTQVGILGLPAKGGHLIEYDWDGNIVWEHEDNTQHHDFRRLANGNTIYLAWRLLDEDMVKRHTGGLAGSEHADGVYGDVLREINPAGEGVWEWFVGTDMDMEQFPIHPGTWRQEYAHGNTVAECPNGDIMINQRMTGFMGHIDKQTKKIQLVPAGSRVRPAARRADAGERQHIVFRQRLHARVLPWPGSGLTGDRTRPCRQLHCLGIFDQGAPGFFFLVHLGLSAA